MNGEAETDRPLRDFTLWLAMVGSPTIWLIQFQTIYMLVYPACGSHHNAVIHATCAGFALCIAVILLIAWRHWTSARAAETAGRTRRFMAVTGVMVSGLFLVVVIAQWIAAVMVDPCPI
jgi:hypothetical protein